MCYQQELPRLAEYKHCFFFIPSLSFSTLVSTIAGSNQDHPWLCAECTFRLVGLKQFKISLKAGWGPGVIGLKYTLQIL